MHHDALMHVHCVSVRTSSALGRCMIRETYGTSFSPPHRPPCTRPSGGVPRRWAYKGAPRVGCSPFPFQLEECEQLLSLPENRHHAFGGKGMALEAPLCPICFRPEGAGFPLRRRPRRGVDQPWRRGAAEALGAAAALLCTSIRDELPSRMSVDIAAGAGLAAEARDGSHRCVSAASALNPIGRCRRRRCSLSAGSPYHKPLSHRTGFECGLHAESRVLRACGVTHDASKLMERRVL